jgi:hypothetical protein
MDHARSEGRSGLIRHLSTERCKDLLIVAMLPFLVVLWVQEGKPRWEKWRSENALPERQCEIYHQSQLPGKRCTTYDEEPLYFHG